MPGAGADRRRREGRGGLAVRLDERHHYEIEVGGGEVRVVARIGSVRPVVATAAAPAGPVRLRIDVLATPPGDWHPCKEPDVLRLGVEEADGTFDVLAELDGRYLSTEVAGGFTGRVIGMYAAAGTVRFDWFDYEHPAATHIRSMTGLGVPLSLLARLQTTGPQLFQAFAGSPRCPRPSVPSGTCPVSC